MYFKRFILLITFLLFPSIHILLAEGNVDNTLKSPDNKSISKSEDFITLPNSFLYPEYFRNTDQITWDNIKNELSFKNNYFKGKRPEQRPDLFSQSIIAGTVRGRDVPFGKDG